MSEETKIPDGAFSFSLPPGVRVVLEDGEATEVPHLVEPQLVRPSATKQPAEKPAVNDPVFLSRAVARDLVGEGTPWDEEYQGALPDDRYSSG